MLILTNCIHLIHVLDNMPLKSVDVANIFDDFMLNV